MPSLVSLAESSIVYYVLVLHGRVARCGPGISDEASTDLLETSFEE